ncbi:DUF4124 domain-containing protein [Cupriavidus pauculus]|jgi:hypothetical protein|uniref:DUF4124 domain-containing protein n=1 Tax=Cupriavidus pauculus TaxID=82633 RepID=UPI001247A870|nr:DUF4124 domain-containing protein [Cupriavidus pauculus]KAB0605322.1 DUF4124 domain-containing protein [Cupriavidus pauculus]MCM3605233.1 DUF4124 domain-containing protein [Cupriavidus pauculus]UAK99686.1 DUF4124 domain-containing protein [Cupriavidus pauculus]
MTRSSALYLLIAASLATPAAAFAQWQWKDANGRTVYSDVPPPPSVPERAVISAPGRLAGAYRPLEDEAGRTDAKADANAKPDARMTGNAPRMQPVSAKPKSEKSSDPDEAFRERRDARIKADLEAATKEREQLARQQKCEEMRNYATGLSQGLRVSRVAPDGSPVRLDGAEREAELARANESLNQACSG